MKNVLCHFDGSCTPYNPGGNMGMGMVVFVDNEKLIESSVFAEASPTNSNNVAEYLAFESVLNFLIDKDLTQEKITIIGDSMLVIQQMNESWKIKSGLYKEIAIKCIEKVNIFFRDNANFTIKWVRRDDNAIADLLSRKTETV